MCNLKEVLGESLPVSGDFQPLRPGPKPKFSDVEVIVLSLVSDCMGIDSESYLFNILNSTYKKDFPNLLSRRQFNYRRIELRHKIREFTLLVADVFAEIKEDTEQEEKITIIDSMPLEICKYSRKDRNKWSENPNYLPPTKGICKAQGDKVYFGYKLHAVCNEEGVIKYFDFGIASQHDLGYVKENTDKICDVLKDCTIYGDKGYISSHVKEELKSKGINLITPSRTNQKIQTVLPKYFTKIRKRIETVFSQLCDQFMIQRNYAKSFKGYETRIASKICARNILQYINKFVTKKTVGKVKYALM